MPSSPAEIVSSDRPLRGIGYMLIAGLLFVMLDSAAKWMTSPTPRYRYYGLAMRAIW